jgi:hypothetical protein
VFEWREKVGAIGTGGSGNIMYIILRADAI